MKLAIIHEYLNQYGGAERVLQMLSAMFPRAPIYTMIYDAALTGGVFSHGTVIRTSFLQKLPFSTRLHHPYSLLMPLAVERFDMSYFDTVLSVSASFAKGVITKPHTRHISYCLTPPRFLWDDSQKFVREFGYYRFVKKLSLPALSYLRVWDIHAAKRVDKFIAISEFVRARIAKYYNKDAEVVYPPVNNRNFAVSMTSDDYFLMVGRLVTYKKFDVAIKAFNRLGLPMKIIGTGIEEKRLRSIAKKNIEFLGQVDDETLVKTYANARALIFPQEEDFGIVPLEAMSSGKPVIAYHGGGAVETVSDGETGIFFDEQSEDAIIAAVKEFDSMSFDPRICRAQAERFGPESFNAGMLRILTE